MNNQNIFAMSFPAIEGDNFPANVVTQGHADYCAANGHATHTVDGVDQGFCPRCGTVTRPATNTPEEKETKTMTKLTTEQQEYREELKAMLPKGSQILTLVRSVSSSGMSRRISVFVVKDNDLINLDWRIERAGIAKRRARKDGLYIQGTGMDMCFALTYDIAIMLHGDGYSITNSNI